MIVVGLLSFAASLTGEIGRADAERRDELASVRDLLERKVPGAVRTLSTAVQAFDALGDLAAVPTDTLLGSMADLERGRVALSSVDHAFKQAVTLDGKPIDTGLLGLDALRGLDPNVRQLRISDELMRRGVPPDRIPHGRTLNEWLQGMSGEAVRRFSTDAPLIIDRDTGLTTGGSQSGRPWNELTPVFQAELDAIRPGYWECGLVDVLARYGVPLEAWFDSGNRPCLPR